MANLLCRYYCYSTSSSKSRAQQATGCLWYLGNIPRHFINLNKIKRRRSFVSVVIHDLWILNVEVFLGTVFFFQVYIE